MVDNGSLDDVVERVRAELPRSGSSNRSPTPGSPAAATSGSERPASSTSSRSSTTTPRSSPAGCGRWSTRCRPTSASARRARRSCSPAVPSRSVEVPDAGPIGRDPRDARRARDRCPLRRRARRRTGGVRRGLLLPEPPHRPTARRSRAGRGARAHPRAHRRRTGRASCRVADLVAARATLRLQSGATSSRPRRHGARLDRGRRRPGRVRRHQQRRVEPLPRRVRRRPRLPRARRRPVRGAGRSVRLVRRRGAAPTRVPRRRRALRRARCSSTTRTPTSPGADGCAAGDTSTCRRRSSVTATPSRPASGRRCSASTPSATGCWCWPRTRPPRLALRAILGAVKRLVVTFLRQVVLRPFVLRLPVRAEAAHQWRSCAATSQAAGDDPRPPIGSPSVDRGSLLSWMVTK